MTRTDIIALSLIGIAMSAIILPTLYGVFAFMVWAEPTIIRIIN